MEAHPGIGIKKDGKGHAQQSVADQNNLPPGYRHIVGFVVGYNFYDSRFVARDINTAIRANYKVAIIIGEMKGRGNKVVIYEKGKPLPVY